MHEFVTNLAILGWARIFAKFHVLKLTDLYKLERAKFMYKFENGLLPISFNNYFTNLKSIHSYNTRYKVKSKFFLPGFRTNYGKKHTSVCWNTNIVRSSSKN